MPEGRKCIETQEEDATPRYTPIPEATHTHTHTHTHTQTHTHTHTHTHTTAPTQYHGTQHRNEAWQT